MRTYNLTINLSNDHQSIDLKLTGCSRDKLMASPLTAAAVACFEVASGGPVPPVPALDTVVQVMQDGNQVMALYGRNLQEGISGFGISMAAALRDLATHLEKKAEGAGNDLG